MPYFNFEKIQPIIFSSQSRLRQTLNAPTNPYSSLKWLKMLIYCFNYKIYSQYVMKQELVLQLLGTKCKQITYQKRSSFSEI